jgi:transcriptional antiterminator RfaH
MKRDCHWCVVYTKPQRENLAEMSLQQRGFETFFPKLLLPNSAKRTRRIVAMFPNYVFIRLNDQSYDYSRVNWCPGIKRLVSFDGIPAIIANSTIAFLMDQVGSNGLISACCKVDIGQQVTIDGGPFNGFVGIIQAPPNAKGRIKVLLQLLSRLANVDVPLRFVNVSWTIPRQQLAEA